MKILNCILLITIFISSCVNVEKKNDQIPTLVSINKANFKSIEFNSMVDKISIIGLKTSKECIFGGNVKVIVDTNNVYVLDTKMTKSIYIFNKDGDYITKISALGKGPGEYLSIIDFTIGTEIYFIDNLGGKILKYNKLGKFISEKKIPGVSMKGIGFNGAILYVYQERIKSHNSEIILYDKDLHAQQILKMNSDNLERMKILSTHYFINYKDKILFHEGCSPDLYTLEENKISNFIRFNFIKSINSEIKDFSQLLQSGIPYFLGDFYLNKNWISLVYYTGNRVNKVFFKEIDKIIYNFQDDYVFDSNNLDDYYRFLVQMYPKYSENNILWGTSSLNKLKRFIKLIEDKKLTEQILINYPDIKPLFDFVNNASEFDDLILIGWHYT